MRFALLLLSALVIPCTALASSATVFPPANCSADEERIITWKDGSTTTYCRTGQEILNMAIPDCKDGEHVVFHETDNTGRQAVGGDVSHAVLRGTFVCQSCPAGFTRLGKLGCLQNTLEGVENCISAIITCYEKYQGRLPGYSERLIGHFREGLPATNNEWIDVGAYGGDADTFNARSYCSVFRGPKDTTVTPNIEEGAPGALPYYENVRYRCFIP